MRRKHRRGRARCAAGHAVTPPQAQARPRLCASCPIRHPVRQTHAARNSNPSASGTLHATPAQSPPALRTRLQPKRCHHSARNSNPNTAITRRAPPVDAVPSGALGMSGQTNMPLESLIVEKTLSPTFPTRWRSSKSARASSPFHRAARDMHQKERAQRGRTP